MNPCIPALKRFIPVSHFLLATGIFVVAQNAEIEWKESSVSFDESAGTVEVTLVRSENMIGLATVFYRTVAVPGSATSGSDFQSISNRQALFTTNKKEVIVTTTINQDFQEEGSETYLLQLYNPNTGTGIGSNKDLTITIIDDDVATVEWSQGIARVGEDATFVELTATRSGGTGASASVDYATSSGTASQVLDFQSKSGTINFLAGETQKRIQININNDIFTESDEEFTVQLSNPNSAELGSQSQVRVIIEDDESAPGTIGWSVASVQEIEGDTQIQLIAQRTGGSQGSVSVQYSTAAGTAESDIDFSSTTGQFTWGPGSTTPRQIMVNLLEDQIDEMDETFDLVLSGLVGSASLGQSVVTITIQDDDDVSSPGKVGFSTDNLVVSESVGTASIIVSRIGGAAGDLEVNYGFTDSTATNGTDFSGVAGTLQWFNGETEDKFILVPVLDDGSFEADETFFLTLSASDETILSEITTTTVIIENDDINNPGTVVFAAGAQTVSEDAGTVLVTVQRLGGATGEVSVAYQTFEGTASTTLDFGDQVGTLNWGEGDSADQEISVSIVNDQLFEGSETFSIQLSNTPGGSVAGANGLHVITIADDEPQPSTWFEFSRVLYSGTESSGLVNVTIDRFGDGVGEASVRLQSESATAIAGVDYTLLNTLLTWPDGDLAPVTVSLSVLDDEILEQDERVALILAEPSENALVGAVAEAQALIYDDDGSSGQLVNLSTRGYVGLGDEVLIGGFIIFNGPQRVLIRAVGPSLAGVEGALPDPAVQIINNANQSEVAENDNWTENISQIQAIIDTGLGDLNGNEAALLLTLPEGSYSAVLSANGRPGIGSIEIYVDVSAGLSGDLINISTRGRISGGDEILIGGLIIVGPSSKRFLFRGMGPSLIIPGTPSLNDPELLLLNQAGQIIHSNDNWMDAGNWDEIEATELAPMESESAMLLDLDPGTYTLNLISSQGTAGVGLVEIYGLN